MLYTLLAKIYAVNIWNNDLIIFANNLTIKQEHYWLIKFLFSPLYLKFNLYE